MEKNSNIKEIEYQSVSLPKRFLAGFLDLIFTIFLSLILFSISYSIFISSDFYKDSSSDIESILISSGFYVETNNQDDTASYQLITTFLDNDKSNSNNYKLEIVKEKVEYFYLELNCYINQNINPNYGIDLLNGFKESKTDLFYYDETTSSYIENDNVISLDFYLFYKDIIENHAIGELINNDQYLSITTSIFSINITMIIIIFLFSIIILYFIVPLIFYRGHTTLGKKIFKFGSLNINGLCLSFWQFLVKFLIFFFIEVVLSLFTFFIPLFISIGMMTITKAHQNFNEYLTNTYSLSYENKKFYLNYFEYISKNNS